MLYPESSYLSPLTVKVFEKICLNEAIPTLADIAIQEKKKKEKEREGEEKERGKGREKERNQRYRGQGTELNGKGLKV